MRRVLVSLHHSHGHSGVVIGDEGVLLVRDLRAAAVGWAVLQGDRPGLLEWPDGHVVAGGLLPGGATSAAVIAGGRRAAAVVAGGAWIVAAAAPEDGDGLPVVFTAASGQETGRAVAQP